MADEDGQYYDDGESEYDDSEALLTKQREYEEEPEPEEQESQDGEEYLDGEDYEGEAAGEEAEEGDHDIADDGTEYDEDGIMINRDDHNENFANLHAANYYEGGETETNAGTDADTEVGDLESHYDAEEDDTRNYIDEYEVAPVDEPLSTDKKLERLGLNKDKKSEAGGGGDDNDGSSSGSNSDSDGSSDYGQVEMLYYNPHRMSDVLLSDIESRVLKYVSVSCSILSTLSWLILYICLCVLCLL